MDLQTPQGELYARLRDLGWELGKIDFRGGQYVARAKNPATGQDCERTGRSPEQALLGVINFAQRAAEVRRFAALRKLGAWQTDWLDQREEIAKAYRDLPPFDQTALAAWQALANESLAQAAAARRQIRVELVDDGEPYASVQELRDDVNKKQKLLVSRATLRHPVWTPDEALAFQIVHDAVAHAQSGGGFDWRGENAAAAVHLALLSPDAQEAAFVEILGRAAYLDNFRGHGSDKIGLLTQFVGPARELEGQHTHVPHGDQAAQQEQERAQLEQQQAEAAWFEKVRTALPPSAVYELPTVSDGWKAKPSVPFRPRSGLVDPHGAFEGLPGIGDRLRGSMGAVVKVIDYDIGRGRVVFEGPRGSVFSAAYDEVRASIADGRMIVLDDPGPVPEPQEGGDWEQAWPDTLPWGEAEQDFYRNAGLKTAMPVVRPKGVDAYLQGLVGQDELHAHPDRTGSAHCPNPKCSYEMTYEDQEEAAQTGQWSCPACGFEVDLDQADEKFTRAGLGLSQMGDIGEEVVSRLPGFQSASAAYNYPIDFVYDAPDGTRYGVEVKTNHSEAQERFKVGTKRARDEKIRYCNQNGLAPALVGVRLNFYTDRADVFFRPGLTDTWIGNSQMQHLGQASFADINPFKAPTTEEQQAAVQQAEIPDQSLADEEGAGWSTAAARDPDLIFVYYKSELRVENWHHNRKVTDILDELFDEFGRDMGNEGLDIDPDEVAAGVIYEYDDGDYRVEHEQMNDPDVRRHAERLIAEHMESWRPAAGEPAPERDSDGRFV